MTPSKGGKIMKRRFRNMCTEFICIWVAMSLLGCSLAWEPVSNPILDSKTMKPVVARVLDEQLALVGPVLAENGDLPPALRDPLMAAQGSTIVDRMLAEEGGEDYLRFSHAVMSGATADEVLAESEALLGSEEFEELRGRMISAERTLRADAETHMRAIPPSQRPAFMRDLQKLVTKTLVLMVAGIVYACIPKVVVWGKITAAAAISIAAGITATTIMSLYRYYKYDEESLSQSFQEWIVDVTTDPAASYAVAASMTTLGKTMTNGPVVTGLIIVVFSIYQVMDMVKPMLKKYNFNA